MPRGIAAPAAAFALALALGAAACGEDEPAGAAESESESESESEGEGGGTNILALIFDLIETPEPGDAAFDLILDLQTWDSSFVIEPNVRSLLPPGRATFRFDLANRCVTLLEAGGTFPSGNLHCSYLDSETGCACREVEIADPPVRFHSCTDGFLFSADCACEPGYVVAYNLGDDAPGPRWVGYSLMNPEACDVPKCFWMEWDGSLDSYPDDYDPACDAAVPCADYPWCGE